jgi:hypothetical protein
MYFEEVFLLCGLLLFCCEWDELLTVLKTLNNTFCPAGIYVLKSPLAVYFKGSENNLKSTVFPGIKIQNFYTP